MVMILFFLIVSRKIIAHRIKLVTGREICGRIIVNAPWATVKQRASTPKGPIKESAINEKINVPFFPKQLKKSEISPLKSIIPRTPRKGTRTPVSKMPNEANKKCPSLCVPTEIGNTKFPEPKNMENNANPVLTTSNGLFITYPLCTEQKKTAPLSRVRSSLFTYHWQSLHRSAPQDGEVNNHLNRKRTLFQKHIDVNQWPK